MQIVLVHGAWHGAWCWEKVIPHLTAQGHSVLAPDLPGHGSNAHVPLEEISLQTYVDTLCSLLNEPSILVGHSMAGMIISQVAEKLPHLVKHLVYLAAVVPRNGCAMLELLTALNPDSSINQILEVDPGRQTLRVVGEGLRRFFYNACSLEDLAAAKRRITPQPLRPQTDQVLLSQENFGRLPKTYIRCTLDRAIPPSVQDHFAQSCHQRLTLETDHSPFFSAPQELAALLQRIL